MRLSDLRGKKVRTAAGETVGRVHEVHCDRGRVVALMCGAPSLIERLTAKAHGRRVPWEDVLRVDEQAVVIGPKKRGARRSPS
jgi:sporulation protein YlmC with PRC-barrel domain